jgi:hypothetical protein
MCTGVPEGGNEEMEQKPFFGKDSGEEFTRTVQADRFSMINSVLVNQY